MPRLRLIVGLGNPGARYAETRHNAGFHFIDALARREGVSFAASRQFNGEVAELGFGEDRVRLLKPATFMNLSGQAVAPMARFYRYQPEEILVAHDELDLPPGTVRIKKGGGHGGHNGLRDTVARLGSSEFLRLRIGIGHPGHKDLVLGYVLQRAPQDERQAVAEAIDRVGPVMPALIEGDTQRAMNELHRRDTAA